MKSEGTEMREIHALVEADYKMVILRKYEVMIWENRVNVGQKKLVNYIAEEDLSDVLSHVKSCCSERYLGWQKYGRKQSAYDVASKRTHSKFTCSWLAMQNHLM